VLIQCRVVCLLYCTYVLLDFLLPFFFLSSFLFLSLPFFFLSFSFLLSTAWVMISLLGNSVRLYFFMCVPSRLQRDAKPVGRVNDCAFWGFAFLVIYYTTLSPFASLFCVDADFLCYCPLNCGRLKLGLCLNLSLSLYMVFVVLFLRVLTWLFYYL